MKSLCSAFFNANIPFAMSAVPQMFPITKAFFSMSEYKGCIDCEKECQTSFNVTLAHVTFVWVSNLRCYSVNLSRFAGASLKVTTVTIAFLQSKFVFNISNLGQTLALFFWTQPICFLEFLESRFWDNNCCSVNMKGGMGTLQFYWYSIKILINK